MIKTRFIPSLAAMLLCAGILSAQWGSAPGAVTEETDKSQIDYSERIIRATGIGAVPSNAPNVGAARASAIRAAKMDAIRNLIEAVKDVRVTSETTVRNNMVESDVITSKVEAMIRGAQQDGDVRYLSDSSVELTMFVPMSGISDVFLPDATGVPAPVTPTGEPAPAAAEASVTGPAQPGQPVTGMIVDVRGLGIRPSMSPKVQADDGSILYGPGKYPREFAVAQGVVGYHKNIDAAMQDPRVAGNPVVVKGIRSVGNLSTDVIISSADSRTLAAYPGFADAVGACRVMFILD